MDDYKCIMWQQIIVFIIYSTAVQKFNNIFNKDLLLDQINLGERTRGKADLISAKEDKRKQKKRIQAI